MGGIRAVGGRREACNGEELGLLEGNIRAVAGRVRAEGGRNEVRRR